MENCQCIFDTRQYCRICQPCDEVSRWDVTPYLPLNYPEAISLQLLYLWQTGSYDGLCPAATTLHVDVRGVLAGVSSRYAEQHQRSAPGGHPERSYRNHPEEDVRVHSRVCTEHAW